jgi:hypothetical protein
LPKFLSKLLCIGFCQKVILQFFAKIFSYIFFILFFCLRSKGVKDDHTSTRFDYVACEWVSGDHTRGSETVGVVAAVGNRPLASSCAGARKLAAPLSSTFYAPPTTWRDLIEFS